MPVFFNQKPSVEFAGMAGTAAPYRCTGIDYFLVCQLNKKAFVYKVKVKVKVTLEQATKAQKGSRGIALLFL
jgi:hypothetical protein